MTVATTASRVDYLASGANCVFAYTFLITDQTALAVYQCGTLITTGYSVSGAGSITGGNVTFSAVPVAGSQIALLRNESYTQPLDLVENSAMSANSLEGALDKGTLLDQQLKEITDRALRVAPCETGTSMLLPGANARANKYLTFDSSGNPSVADAATASGTSVTISGGTTARTLATRFTEMPTPYDFDAIGDGTTNDYDALVRWIAALTHTGVSGATGGALYMPPGIFAHGSTLAWPNKGFTVFGASDMVSVFRYTGTATGHTISSDGSTYVNAFKNLAFINSSTANFVFDALKSGRLVMEDVRFRADGGTPILMRVRGDATAAQQTELRNVYFNGASNATIGLQLVGTALPGVSATNIFGGRINQCTVAGLDLATVRGVHVYGLNTEGNVIGVRIDGVQQATLDSLWYESNTTADVQIAATSVSTVGITIQGESTWATSAPLRNVDLQTPAGGLTVRGVDITGQDFTGNATGTNIRIQSGVTCTFLTRLTFSCSTDISDVGSATQYQGVARWNGEFIDCSTERMLKPVGGTPKLDGAYSEGQAKFYLVFDGRNADPIVPAVSYNICTATNKIRKTSTGDYSIFLDRPFACATWVLGGSARHPSTNHCGLTIALHTMNTGCLRILTVDSFSSCVDAFPITVFGYGAQS